MKILSLNIWDARIFEPLMAFFKRHQEIDVFLLQEVFNGPEAATFSKGMRLNGFSEISKILPDHSGFYQNTVNLDDNPANGSSIPYGLGVFVKNSIPILSHHHDFILNPTNFDNQNPATHARVIQSICVSHNDKPLAISNVHAVWSSQGKIDTPERLEQSAKIKSHVQSFNHAVVLAGDFNLLPDTKSLAIASEGMRDLIGEYGIASTRSKLYTKHDNPVLFADYAFTSPDLTVKNFEVWQEEVSDHLPLYIEL